VAFSEDVSRWNVSSLEMASRAFAGTEAFNHSLCDWGSQLSIGVIVDNMFEMSGCPWTEDPEISIGSPFCHRCGHDATIFYTTEQLYGVVDRYMDFILSGSNETLDVLEQYGPIDTWDVSRISDFSRLFDIDRKNGIEELYSAEADEEGCVLTNENLGKWDMSSATTIEGMFLKCREFTGKGT